MNFKTITEHKSFRPAGGAGLAVLCGLLLWGTRLGDAWENASYDYLFRFATRPAPNTNKVVLILMDNVAYTKLVQKRDQLWNRALHATLLKQLAADGCKLVVFDVHFKSQGKAEVDETLAKAMQRQGNVVLMAKADDPQAPGLSIEQVELPHERFVNAATNWGIAYAGVALLETPRRHWPFPSPNNHRSLPWAAARAAGATLTDKPEKRWLRYYKETEAWVTWSYHLAPTNAPGHFRNKIVFIGSDPEDISDLLRSEEDKFCTPYTRWTGEAVGGVKIMATTFLNLMNGDWLRRPAEWVELVALGFTGVLLGGALCRMRPLAACGLAAGTALAVSLGAVSLSYFTNYWFPWSMIVAGQLPCALVWGLVSARIPADERGPGGTLVIPAKKKQPATLLDFPDIPDYEPFHILGKGYFGTVWLVRSPIGQWQALKVVYQAKFDHQRPYDIEFEGIEKYKPVSEKHLGLLRVEYVSRKRPDGFFYYVMELGDAQSPGWEDNPATYRPWTLWSLCEQAHDKRVAVGDCLRIGIALTEALDFLHRNGLTHRDIKPTNIIFVNRLPKLADVGLVTHARRSDQSASGAGTPDFMPPAPEPNGTVQADIYALGKVLYVISTGRTPASFPSLPTTLVDQTGNADFMRLNRIFCKACDKDLAHRYASAAEMRDALLEAHKALEGNTAR